MYNTVHSSVIRFKKILICYSVHWFCPLGVKVLKKEVTVVEALDLGLEDHKERL